MTASAHSSGLRGRRAASFKKTFSKGVVTINNSTAVRIAKSDQAKALLRFNVRSRIHLACISEMKLRFLIVVLLASGVLVVFAAVKASSSCKATVRTYFSDAHGLRAGAPVRVAGVEVGRVSSVRVRDDLRDKPAEVTMSLETRYKLKIPSDAVVRLESDGVLGGNYPEIDIRNARGSALPDGGTLKSEESKAASSRDLLECLAAIANHQGCKIYKASKVAPQNQPIQAK